MFNPRRNRVVIKSREGKIERWGALGMYRATINKVTERAMFMAKSMSIMTGGSGKINIAMINISAIARAISLALETFSRDLSPPSRAVIPSRISRILCMDPFYSSSRRPLAYKKGGFKNV